MTADEKAEDAGVALMSGASPALTTVTNFYAYHTNALAISDEDSETRIDLPCVTVEFQSRGEMHPQTGILLGDLVFTIRMQANDTTATALKAITEEVFSCVYTDDFCARLTTAGVGGFHCFGFEGEAKTAHEMSGKVWENSLSIPIVIGGADLV